MTAVAQLCVLGGTWIFGFFLFQENGTEVMLYLFTILNSLQGALIFIMHCLLSKPVPKIPHDSETASTFGNSGLF